MPESWSAGQSERRQDPAKPPSGAELAGESAAVEPDADTAPTVLSSSRPSSSPFSGGVSNAGELTGEMLGHYRIDGYIGVGGMGTVFRARDTRLDRPVALKVLPPEQALRLLPRSDRAPLSQDVLGRPVIFSRTR